MQPKNKFYRKLKIMLSLLNKAFEQKTEEIYALYFNSKIAIK